MQTNASSISSTAQRDPRNDAAAHNELFALLYSDLRRLARREAFRFGPQAEMSPTTLLHEAYLDIQRRGGLAFPDRERFLAYAARAMRGVAIDRARERASLNAVAATRSCRSTPRMQSNARSPNSCRASPKRSTNWPSSNPSWPRSSI